VQGSEDPDDDGHSWNENIRSAFETGQGSDSNGEIRKRTKLLKNVMIAAAVIVLAVAG